jgi:cell wall-associated NlpC family hydrolase
MSRATLYARLGVTAASLVTVFGLAAAPALASSPRFGPANPPTFGPNTTSSPSEQLSLSQPTRKSEHHEKARLHNQRVHKVLREAARQRGKPYVYGEDGPHGFDCSGLVRFVFLHALHRSLPHNAAAQYDSLSHIRRQSLRPGDLVFVDNGGYVSHVGIYDGHGYWWVAPHSGTHVQRQKIYSAHLLYARVITYALPRHYARKHKH